MFLPGQHHIWIQGVRQLAALANGESMTRQEFAMEVEEQRCYMADVLCPGLDIRSAEHIHPAALVLYNLHSAERRIQSVDPSSAHCVVERPQRRQLVSAAEEEVHLVAGSGM